MSNEDIHIDPEVGGQTLIGTFTERYMNGLMREIQEGAGEARRQALGIDGSAGDAQDVPHNAYLPQAVTVCLVCGLAPTARVHHRPHSSS